jgi:hypothetical protein
MTAGRLIIRSQSWSSKTNFSVPATNGRRRKNKGGLFSGIDYDNGEMITELAKIFECRKFHG